MIVCCHSRMSYRVHFDLRWYRQVATAERKENIPGHCATATATPTLSLMACCVVVLYARSISGVCAVLLLSFPLLCVRRGSLSPSVAQSPIV